MQRAGEEDLGDLVESLEKIEIAPRQQVNMQSNVQEIVNMAVTAALNAQRDAIEAAVRPLREQIGTLSHVDQVVPFERIIINPQVACDESLDVVKSLPEFSGNAETYVSWREAAHNAYEVFRPYNGSSKHYQAVTIMRNKVRGAADAVLSSFSTVLNFEAIIQRLDFTYADKRPAYLVEQELSTLRQGNMSVLEFYDEVEKKLVCLVNKTRMAHRGEGATVLIEKYRADALRVFVSGLRKPLCDILFASQPDSLPSALAMAQEVNANRERYAFASRFDSRPVLGYVGQSPQHNSTNFRNSPQS